MTIDNNFQTPISVCKYMVSMLTEKHISILEPTPGLGNLAGEISSTGRGCLRADDFFLLDKDLRFDAVVMNPPFSSLSAFMENAPKDVNLKGMKLGYHILFECMKKTDYVIALMPWLTIADSDVRLRALRDYGLKSVTPLPRKTFQYARVQTCIIELERGYDGETIFKTQLI